MCNSTPEPEKRQPTPDELDRLEAMHQRLKERQEAWRKLMDILRDRKPNTNPEAPNATPEP